MNALWEYPHIADRITLLWGSQDLPYYLDSLLVQEKTRMQLGLSPAAFSEILFIAATHEMIYGY